MRDLGSQKDAQDHVLTPEEILLRKLWLKFTATDEALLKNELDSLFAGKIDDLMAAMYEHFLTFDETRAYFPNQEVLERARSAQGKYFERLTQGNYDQDYVNNRLRVGTTHYRTDLDPKWYMGAYNCALLWLLPLVMEKYAGKESSTKLMPPVSALLKVIFLDMGLAIESYITAKEVAIRKQRDALTKLETEKRVTKSILENAPIGIVATDADYVCLECNDEFVRILDRQTREEVIGHRLFDLAPRLNRQALQKVLRSEKPHRKSADALEFADAAQTDQSYWDWAAWPVKDDMGAVSGLVAMFANSTDRVLLQQQREDFVATLTHDLKTPVSATNRAVRFLLDGDFGTVSNEQREVLETILQSNTALYSLVETLLDVYRFDSGVKELNMKRCNLQATMSQLISEIMPLAQEKGVSLTMTLPETIEDLLCDETEIRRLLQNLIDNSLKFTPHGGSITISVKQDSGKTQVAVKDTGKGIPEENKPKLFQRFWQAGSTGRYYASTGLGLYLCRRIVEAHGGRIWCDSEVGHGSTFSFEI